MIKNYFANNRQTFDGVLVIYVKVIDQNRNAVLQGW